MQYSNTPGRGRGRGSGYSSGSQFSYRGRGRGGGFNKTSSSSVQLPPDRDILLGVQSSPLQTIEKPKTSSAADIKVKDLKYIGSYNWTNSSTTEIIVPGSPREWIDKALPFSVAADTGVTFVDQNSSRMPSGTFIPLIKAVETVAKDKDISDFKWSSVDFVTDRNGLRKLLRWIDGTAEKEFRIDVQLVGNKTIMLSRWEKRNQEILSGFTFGFNFEKASTKPAPGCGDGTGHHRIVTYSLDVMVMVVRFEVDACLPTTSAKTPASSSSDLDDLANALSGMKVISTHSSTSSSASNAASLHVVRGGSYVPHSSLIEMTTRVAHREAMFEWKDAFPQLFFSQTPNHFLAVHQKGFFEKVKKRKLDSAELLRVEQDCQASFKKLRAALQIIKDIAMEHGQRGRLSLICQAGVLKVYERTTEESCLPDDMMELFEA